MPELIVILVIILIIFGAGKLPQIGEGLGKGIRNFKKATKDKEEIDVTPKKPEEISEKKWTLHRSLKDSSRDILAKPRVNPKLRKGAYEGAGWKAESLLSSIGMGHIAYIGIGSNLGDKLYYCEKAISEILKIDRHKLLAKSSLFKTEPIGYTSQDWFVNGVLKIETDLEPSGLLRTLKTIEARLGRTETFQWGPRTIDLDILFFDDVELHTRDLQIPHPLIQKRRFVLIPLAEIDRNLIHPVLKKTVQELLNDFQEDQKVEKL